ncbi:MAG: iron-sulfur cluster repair di-iron protein [Candidatus Kapaibacterium sp.]
MEMIQTSTIGSFVAKDYRAASVFQKYGIDFCCRGGRPLNEVCERNNLSPETILSELAEVMRDSSNTGIDFQSWDLDLLADYVERKHHRYIHRSAPPITQFLDKLCEVHGQNHPELFEIRKEFSLSIEALNNHMQKEEGVLFPIIRNMVQKPESFKEPSGNFTVKSPISVMMEEHDAEGERFRKISELSNGYTTPADGCTTYRVAFSMLKEFEEDLHHHIHLENNILFPKAIEMEKAIYQ